MPETRNDVPHFPQRTLRLANDASTAPPTPHVGHLIAIVAIIRLHLLVISFQFAVPPIDRRIRGMTENEAAARAVLAVYINN